MKKFSNIKDNNSDDSVNEHVKSNMELRNAIYTFTNNLLYVTHQGIVDPILFGQTRIEGVPQFTDAIVNFLETNGIVKENNSYSTDLSIFEKSVESIYDSRLILERMYDVLNDSRLTETIKKDMYKILNNRYKLIK